MEFLFDKDRFHIWSGRACPCTAKMLLEDKDSESILK